MRTLTAPLLLAASALCAQADQPMLAGMTAMRQQDHTAAEQAFSKAVAAAPADLKAWYYRAVNRIGMGDLDGALQDLDQALAIDPLDAHSLLRRAEVRSRQGADLAATADLRRVLAARPTGPAAEHALLHLGHFAMGRRDYAEARALYDRLIAIAPYNAFGWCDRGIALAAMHQHDEALDDLDRAVELDPTLDQAHVQRALVLFRMDRKQEACAALHQAHDLGDRSVEEMLLIHCE
ncbi:MAG: tetratricopeptide repeat protein [Flavobacteriales bacterium]|nr:MAG: tetratricopeptide repeat protein [Flavobacteriales bacterium]